MLAEITDQRIVFAEMQRVVGNDRPVQAYNVSSTASRGGWFVIGEFEARQPDQEPLR